MLVFVTAFHPLRPDMASYLADFDRLATTGVPLLVFTSVDLPSYPNVRTVPCSFDTSWIPDEVRLPANRTPEKDTTEFLALMLLKMTYMNDALAYTDASHLAWVDFRIFHVVRDTVRVQEKLRSLASSSPSSPRLLAPGCWGPQASISLDSICWRYCGGFLLGPREAFPPAYARQTELVHQHLPRLTWEVNYWAMMDDHFQWYAADHNDSLILNAFP